MFNIRHSTPTLLITCAILLLVRMINAADVSSRDEPATSAKNTVTLRPDHPLIHFHGRWDSAPGTWWAGSGFKLHVAGLKSLVLNLGSHTTAPLVAVGFSIDYAPFVTVNVSAGANIIPLPASISGKKNSSVLRLNVEGWQNNRIHLESVELNAGAQVLPYKPSELAFQFIGDSLTAGQYNVQGVVSSWGFLTAEAFKAEYTINAQPGACLTDQLCWGNYHGISYQYFKTEDTGYYYTTDHNYTTDWAFKRDISPTHVVLHIGANDNAYNITGDAFVTTYLGFLERLRKLYPQQPFFVFTPWGWPSADGSVGYYYDGRYAEIVQKRKKLGDKQIYLVDTTGWVGWDDVYHDNTHPNEQGHRRVAAQFGAWLEKWGLRPKKSWPTST